MPTVKSYAATSPTDPLVPHPLERREVGPHDVLIDIAYAGICHSDIHTVREEWGPIAYPQVVGHEIVGHVREVGDQVTRHQVGDRVGVGCMVNSCRSCDQCEEGREQFCRAGNVGTYASEDVDGSITQGGYSQAIVVNEDFVLRVPESLDFARVAPLLCAGITLYSPLRHWGVGPGTKVAIVGMGGLGHMGVKIAHALGAEVTVLSQSLRKQEDGLRLGADHFYATGDPATFEQLAGRFDVIINTVSAPLDITAYLGLLDVDGTLINVGAPPEPLEVAVFALIGQRRSFAGSLIGGIPETQEMLDFCAEHDILPETELIEASYINEAYERVIASDVRYRFVIDASTF
jgi:alcohol dehydrogenase (NADP+)